VVQSTFEVLITGAALPVEARTREGVQSVYSTALCGTPDVNYKTAELAILLKGEDHVMLQRTQRRVARLCRDKWLILTQGRVI
jgi:hypothetical protein